MGILFSFTRRETNSSGASPPCEEVVQVHDSHPTILKSSDSSFSALNSTKSSSDSSSAATKNVAVQFLSSSTHSSSHFVPSSRLDCSLPSSSLEETVKSFRWSRLVASAITSEGNYRKRKRARNEVDWKEINAKGAYHRSAACDSFVVELKHASESDRNRLSCRSEPSRGESYGTMDESNAEKKYGCHGHFYGTPDTNASHGLALVWSLSKTPLTVLSLITLCRVGSSTRKKVILVDELNARGVVLTYINDF